jgi:uncharacterized protein YebE (UPF0316 family)
VIALDIANTATFLSPETPGAVALERFEANPDLQVIPVVHVGRPVGLLTRELTVLKFAQQFGRDLWARRPVAMFMESEFRAISDQMPISELIDIVARLLEQRFGIAPGRSALLMNGVIYSVAFVLYGPEKILYAILVSFVASRAVDAVLSLGSGMNQVFIITDCADAVGAAVMRDLKRGVTVMDARGGYTGAERAMLLCVMTRSEVPTLTALVAATDPKAFVVVGEAIEVFGKGFRALPS